MSKPYLHKAIYIILFKLPVNAFPNQICLEHFASVVMCHTVILFFLAGLDVKCEACQRFFRDGLTISFTKILTDEAVSGWKFEIHVSFYSILFSSMLI